MNRKYRGKRIDKDEWVRGWFKEKVIENVTHYFIIDEDTTYEVNEESIGQYTGRNDDYGNLIFEGDIISDSLGDFPALVVFENEKYELHNDDDIIDLSDIRKIIIRGNIIDDPELLGAL